MNGLISFGHEQFEDALLQKEVLGSRGIRSASLGQLNMPICPGFIIPCEQTRMFVKNPDTMRQPISQAIAEIQEIMGKSYASGDNVLLLKIVESPVLNIRSDLPSLHHVGLTYSSIETIVQNVGERFAYSEFAYLITSVLKLKLRTLDDDPSDIHAYLAEVSQAKSEQEFRDATEKSASVLPEEFYNDAYYQFEYIVKLFSAAFQTSPTSEDSAIMAQAMVYGNIGSYSASGYVYTHNIITGENSLQGEFFPFSFDEKSEEGRNISELGASHLQALQKMAQTLEDSFKELRWIRFAIENDKLWLVDQSPVPNKSVQAEIKTLLDLLERGVVDSSYVIKKVRPGRISEILHPTLNTESVKSCTRHTGGIAGAVGAAIGRVYFSAESLINAYRHARRSGRESNMILAMEATFAGDVKAIELAQGVLSSEGGYASHAPVVARSLGKVALVYPDAVFRKNCVQIGDSEVKEGDYITLNVPYYEEPVIYIGRGVLQKPALEDSGLIELLDLVQPHLTDIHVYANADQPRDAELAKKFNAQGIGLCRTEHMFFDESRIDRFRCIILADTAELRQKFLDDLYSDQSEDFYELMKIMDNKGVTIRLLDAPLHEFLPVDEKHMKDFIARARGAGFSLTARQIKERAQLLNEFNPMLGHRGVRVAMSYPEIYQMQIRAIFEAAHRLVKEGFSPKPEILIPLVMNQQELKIIRNGKRIEGRHIQSIADHEEEIRKKYGNERVNYTVGTMIELPAAALNAGEIAHYADSFSFGTNDLTQTTYGISRDDFNTFFSDYTELDLLSDNPFKILQTEVMSLISSATMSGRMTRPDLKIGLCGEHGAEPQNIGFIIRTGLDYVSVSPYGIPLAKLAIAQYKLKHIVGPSKD